MEFPDNRALDFTCRLRWSSSSVRLQASATGSPLSHQARSGVETSTSGSAGPGGAEGVELDCRPQSQSGMLVKLSIVKSDLISCSIGEIDPTNLDTRLNRIKKLIGCK